MFTSKMSFAQPEATMSNDAEPKGSEKEKGKKRPSIWRRAESKEKAKERKERKKENEGKGKNVHNNSDCDIPDWYNSSGWNSDWDSNEWRNWG